MWFVSVSQYGAQVNVPTSHSGIFASVGKFGHLWEGWTMLVVVRFVIMNAFMVSHGGSRSPFVGGVFLPT